MASEHRNPLFERVEEDPEYEVRKVLSQMEWDGDLPIDLEEVCDLYDFPYEFKAFPDMSEPGTTKFYEWGFCIVINTHGTDCLDGFATDLTYRRRQRFTFAHEIGHCVYPSHQDVDLQKNLSNPENPHSQKYVKKRENQANQFAANILIPREAFNKVVRNHEWGNIGKLISKVSDIFDVSIQATIQQVANLADFPCMAILFRKNGHPHRIPVRSPYFSDTGFFYHWQREAPSGTLASSILASKTLEWQVQRKPYPDSSTWFPDAGWRAEKFSIIETSFNLGNYGVATFLEFAEIDNY